MSSLFRIIRLAAKHACGLFPGSLAACLALLALTGCSSGTSPALPITQPATLATISPADVPTQTTLPSPILPATPAMGDQFIPEKIVRPQICSPLAGISQDQLEEMISNPFNPPPPGSDEPHQAVDLAIVDQNRVARSGHPISVVLSGEVATIIRDRFPYGNALLVETTLESLPDEWIDLHPLPTPELLSDISPTLTCPPFSTANEWNYDVVSLYLLYAHLQSPPELRLGDKVECGQVIGAIGSSGNALNPHLHLEVRSGPAEARFESMAHYDTSASLQEMAAYCTWRVSGSFPLVDPMSLFSLPP